jgi:pyruvate formate lyase activating enzyme
VRQNRGGELVSLGYGRPTGFAVDPIEKKPLFHFLPGTEILSFGTAGCNLGCKFCQNWDISKARIDERRTYRVTPEEVVDLAVRQGCPSIAYTYNDPVIFAEFVVDVARLARERGLRNVAVTAGYITPEARPEFFRYMDGANVDLKAFTEEFYWKLTLAHLEPVLDTLRWLRHETDVWIEVTTLLIPGRNDSEEEIRAEVRWILDNLGDEVPLHFTAFHPAYRLTDVPPTPPETLVEARELAMSMGMKFVYTGNVMHREGSTTYCPGCGTALIQRSWHRVLACDLRDGACPRCGTRIPGVFS